MTRALTRPRGGRAPAHPYWCAPDHTCSATTITGGQHRSTPLAWDTDDARYVATRTHTPNVGGRLELRVVADLHPDDTIAHHQAALLAQLIQHAVHTAARTASRAAGRRSAAAA
jgi:hypothetical protein